jgi:hypothetical protein
VATSFFIMCQDCERELGGHPISPSRLKSGRNFHVKKHVKLYIKTYVFIFCISSILTKYLCIIMNKFMQHTYACEKPPPPP